MKYGTCVYGEVWDHLMDSARQEATIYGVRIKVVGNIASPRMQRVLGHSYIYGAQLPDYVGTRRCGMTGVEKGPCILPQHSTYYPHVSRTKNPALFLRWLPGMKEVKIMNREQAIQEGMIDE